MLAKFLAYVLSAVLFVHSSYSAYEYSLFKKHLPLDSTYNDLGLPVDVRLMINPIETVFICNIY